ncbi:hypothetical protein [Polymorphospora rubra]|uniref:DUF732 domain-containing protein n=1 Tax=Polymorphospora rubra TaxID=338584 RepID=A0A810MX18_9ACTN|nr:hypothetical protein [Polymorphospora rubra]BCJ65100.1 hypothetical protein Prubr_21210 [Polymorphospora rubra]
MTNRHRRIATLIAVPLAALMLACGAGGTEDDTAADPPAVDSTTVTAGPPGSAPVPSATTRNPANPPRPDDATVARYIAALEAVDPDIVAGKPDRAVDRGRNQCNSIANWQGDRARLIKDANYRFSTAEHPDGFGEVKGGKIVDIVHEFICPDLPMGEA